MPTADWRQRHCVWAAAATAPSAAAACRTHCHLWSSPHSELVLHSVNMTVLGALFSIGAAPRPSNIGIQVWLLGAGRLRA